MNIPRYFNVSPEMTKAQQELGILRKLRIFAVFINFVEEFNPGHISLFFVGWGGEGMFVPFGGGQL